MKKKQVLILTQPCIYEAQKYFAKSFKESFKKLGYSASIHELSSNTLTIHPSTKLLLSFNGNALEYAQKKLPIVSLLVDHPLHHALRLRNETFIHYTLCDSSQEDFLSKQLKRAHCHFLPLPGFTPPLPPSRDLKQKQSIVFFGTYQPYEEIEQRWQEYPSFLRDLIYKCARLITSCYPLPIHIAANTILAKMKYTDPKEVAQHLPLLSIEGEAFSRNYLRYQCLKTLDQANIPVTIYGNGWETLSFKNHTLLPSIPFEETLQVMQQHRVVLDISPFFPHGSHERAKSALLNHSYALTNSSSYLRQHLFAHPHLHYYHWQDLDKLPQIAHSLLHLPPPSPLSPPLPLTTDHFIQELVNRVFT